MKLKLWMSEKYRVRGTYEMRYGRKGRKGRKGIRELFGSL